MISLIFFAMLPPGAACVSTVQRSKTDVITIAVMQTPAGSHLLVFLMFCFCFCCFHLFVFFLPSEDPSLIQIASGCLVVSRLFMTLTLEVSEPLVQDVFQIRAHRISFHEMIKVMHLGGGEIPKQ